MKHWNPTVSLRLRDLLQKDFVGLCPITIPPFFKELGPSCTEFEGITLALAWHNWRSPWLPPHNPFSLCYDTGWVGCMEARANLPVSQVDTFVLVMSGVSPATRAKGFLLDGKWNSLQQVEFHLQSMALPDSTLSDHGQSATHILNSSTGTL